MCKEKIVKPVDPTIPIECPPRENKIIVEPVKDGAENEILKE